VRSLAQATQTTPAEIESLFELAQPVARARVAPPRSKRSAPVGLELQIMRLMVAHPALGIELDHTAVNAVTQSAPDYAEMWEELVATCQAMGEQANFAALAEHLRTKGSDFDAMIAEIAAEPETEISTARLELAGAIRQTRMKLLKTELQRLAASGLSGEEAQRRFRELMQQQEQLRRQAETEIAQR
jgi:DNA primase